MITRVTISNTIFWNSSSSSAVRSALVHVTARAYQNREDQCTHNTHDLRNTQFKDYFRQFLQSFSSGYDGKVRNDVESGNHAHESGTYRRYVGKDQRDHQHAGSIFSKARDGWCDKSDHDQRNTEVISSPSSCFAVTTMFIKVSFATSPTRIPMITPASRRKGRLLSNFFM